MAKKKRYHFTSLRLEDAKVKYPDCRYAIVRCYDNMPLLLSENPISDDEFLEFQRQYYPIQIRMIEV